MPQYHYLSLYVLSEVRVYAFQIMHASSKGFIVRAECQVKGNAFLYI